MKKVALPISIAVGLGLVLGVLWFLGSQQAPAAAAPLAPNSGDWDGVSVAAPLVINDAGQYKMWYQGTGISFYNRYGLGYAESPDGFTWVKSPANPVLTPGYPGEWDSFYRGQITLIKDGSTYKMWYSGGPSDGAWQTGYATSSDGLDWDIYAGNPVLPAGGAGSWDELEADGPTVIKDGMTYKMWYHGCNLDYSICSIGYATSSDGIHWTKYAGNPVLEPTPGEWDAAGLAWPRVIINGSTYHLWYYSDGKLGYATSPDGIQWTKYAGNPVLTTGWDDAPVSLGSILLEGMQYKMWMANGSSSLGTRGIGYLQSTDGIVWTQPVSNPLLRPGETGVIMDVGYEGDDVEVISSGNSAVTITVAGQGGIKATATGITEQNGHFRPEWDGWMPERPDIEPGDRVSAETADYTTSVESVGEIYAQANNDTDMVSGSIHAPDFAPGALTVLCEAYTEAGSQWALDEEVAADGGSFQCDFSGRLDIRGGLGIKVSYLEPDGDMVSAQAMGPLMQVFYGTQVGVGGLYASGHTTWITVTNPVGSIKATTQAISVEDGGWWGHGFRPWWSGGDCCTWSPGDPDIQPGDWVYFRTDDGYQNQVRVGTIYGVVDVEADSITGAIYAPWLSETLEVWCHPQTLYPPEYRHSSAEPDGSLPYFCEWQTPDPEMEPWDIQPEDEVMVHYAEPDGDKVFRMMLASEGAPAPLPTIYLPMVTLKTEQ